MVRKNRPIINSYPTLCREICNLIQYCSLNLYTTVMFLTLKRNTLYTFLILFSLAYFTPGFASIDPEKPKQDQTEQGDGDNQEGVDKQEQDEVSQEQDSELEDSVNPTDTVEMDELPSNNSQIGVLYASYTVNFPSVIFA